VGKCSVFDTGTLINRLKRIPEQVLTWKQIAVEEDETGQQIADALVDIVTEIGRWEQYLEVLTNSQRIQQSISVLYAHILSFLIRARAHYGKPKTGAYHQDHVE
jgi:hypothetical protein